LAQEPLVSAEAVSPGYFETIGVRILRGRPILDSDTAGAAKIALLNQSGARLLWPNEGALGKRAASRGGPFTIVGIVPDFKHRDLRGDVVPQMFMPYMQGTGPFGHSKATLMLKVRPGAPWRASTFSPVISELESKAQVRVFTMTDIRWTAVTMERLRTSVLLMFASVAMFLALAGIFGVVSYAVTQRQREIGLRIALGAGQASVARLVMRRRCYQGYSESASASLSLLA